MTEDRRANLTLDEIQQQIDIFQQSADPAVMAAYEARVLASQRTRSRTPSKRALLDELQQLRRARAVASDEKSRGQG